MLLAWYQHLPLDINPIAFSIGFFSVRWYGLMYLVGFAVVYRLLKFRMVKGEFPVSTPNLVTDYLLVAFFSALIGGRLGYVLFYNAQYYLANPLAIISLYDFQSGKYVGIFGMSYHGALLGIIFGSYLFLKKKKINFLEWADFVIPAAALGYFFGRIGNFLNGELYGRITGSPLGMYFGADYEHLRHPSQLYEAFLEGMLLFVILWNLRNMKFKKGTLFGIYLMGYGLVRIFAEQFRQPDPQVGFLWNHLTMGQFLSFAMTLGGAFLLVSKKGK